MVSFFFVRLTKPPILKAQLSGVNLPRAANRRTLRIPRTLEPNAAELHCVSWSALKLHIYVLLSTPPGSHESCCLPAINQLPAHCCRSSTRSNQPTPTPLSDQRNAIVITSTSSSSSNNKGTSSNGVQSSHDASHQSFPIFIISLTIGTNYRLRGMIARPDRPRQI